ncbi:MAG TPA: DUF4396 domain-containing protein [Dongiaceae bacterium]
MLQGIMTLWFVQAILFAAFVAVDSRWTPASPVLKWGFIIVTLYSGPIGLLLWLLACREPLPGLHERYVAARWRQVVGSTMHCVAGDGIGILAAAAIGSLLDLPMGLEVAFEYAAGFLFGWMIFQALFMRDMVGGSYGKALAATFYAELVSMNGVMAGMVLVSMPWRASLGMSPPSSAAFWFVMSIGLTLGFAVAYPINWWLVARGLKHGMMTIRPAAAPMPAMAMAGPSAGDRQAMHDMAMDAGGEAHAAMSHEAGGSTTAAQRLAFATGTFLLLAIALVISFRLS